MLVHAGQPIRTMSNVPHECFHVQASPSDPENFPFVVLGNKVDLDEGRSRVVRIFIHLLHLPLLLNSPAA